MDTATGPTTGILAVLWRNKLLIVLVVLASAGVAYGLSLTQPTLYEAEGDVLVSDPRSTGGIAEEIGLVLDPSRYVRNQADIMSSSQVAEQASLLLDGALTPREVERSTTVTPAPDRDKLTVKGTQPTADEAVALVDALVAAYEIVVRDSIESRVQLSISTLQTSLAETQARVADLDAELEDDPENAVLEAQRNAAVTQLIALENRIDALATSAALYGSGVQVYVPPDEPQSPVQPKPLRNAAIAAVLGFAAAATLAWWRGDRKTHVDDRGEPAAILGAPLLGVVTDFGMAKVRTPLPAAFEPTSQSAEAFQFVASFVRFALDRTGGTVVVVTSTGAGDGKTTLAANLAIAAASTGDSQPLLIDADERTKGLTRLAEMEWRTGISEFVEYDESPHRHVHTWTFPNAAVSVVPAGRRAGESMSYLRSPRFRRALPELSADRELVVIDAPPLLAVSETVDLAALADGVILVVRPGTPLAELQAARDQLELSGAHLLGYVYNRASWEASGFGYGGLAYGRAETDGSPNGTASERADSRTDAAPDAVP